MCLVCWFRMYGGVSVGLTDQGLSRKVQYDVWFRGRDGILCGGYIADVDAQIAEQQCDNLARSSSEPGAGSRAVRRRRALLREHERKPGSFESGVTLDEEVHVSGCRPAHGRSQ